MNEESPCQKVDRTSASMADLRRLTGFGVDVDEPRESLSGRVTQNATKGSTKAFCAVVTHTHGLIGRLLFPFLFFRAHGRSSVLWPRQRNDGEG